MWLSFTYTRFQDSCLTNRHGHTSVQPEWFLDLQSPRKCKFWDRPIHNTGFFENWVHSPPVAALIQHNSPTGDLRIQLPVFYFLWQNQGTCHNRVLTCFNHFQPMRVIYSSIQTPSTRAPTDLDSLDVADDEGRMVPNSTRVPGRSELPKNWLQKNTSSSMPEQHSSKNRCLDQNWIHCSPEMDLKISG